MKKIFLNLSAGTTLAVAVALTACNNAEQVKKQVDEQNAKIQSLVDEKLNGLQEQVNAECAAKVDSLANAAYAAWQEEQAKATKGKKPAPKKPAPKKEEPKKEPEKPKDNKVDVGQKGTDNPNKINVGQKSQDNNQKRINVGQKPQ